MASRLSKAIYCLKAHSHHWVNVLQLLWIRALLADKGSLPGCHSVALLSNPLVQDTQQPLGQMLPGASPMALFMLGWYLNFPRGPLNFRVSPKARRSMHWDIFPCGYTCGLHHMLSGSVCKLDSAE